MPRSVQRQEAFKERQYVRIMCSVLVGIMLPILIVACQTAEAATTAPAAGDQVMRATLPELAKGHTDKVQLATYATSILVRLDPTVKEFAARMGKEQAALYQSLQAIAKKHHFDLKFQYGSDVMGKARQAQEKEQGAMIESDASADFQRDMLVLMYSDYDWQLNLIRSLAAVVTDPEIKDYLRESQRTHEAGLKEITGLLKHYKFAN